MSKREKIETKPFDYTIYKTEDGKYELLVHRPIRIGIDIIHILTEQESKDYLMNGIQTLEARMAHMTMNYKDYKYSWWR